MANPRIEVEIGAKTDNLIRGVDGAIISLKDLEKESKKLEIALKGATDVDTVATYNAQLSKLQAGMKALKSQGVDPLTKATSSYNGVGIEFSRIIQDAPFGILGVGNNITRLAETFQNLRTQSTSTGAALKTALSSIISPANLLVLGISAVTTALTLWQMGAFESSESTKSLADAAKEAKEEMEEFRLSLDAVTQARIKGESSASKEIGDLKLLREQAENTNVTQKKRLEAVDALQKQYPDTLGNLSKEQILTGQVGTAYEGLTKQIIATSKARAFSDKISENSLELLTIEEKTAKKAEEILKIREKQAQLDKTQSGISRAGFGASALTGTDLLALNNQSDLNDLVQEQLALVAQRNAINAENATLESKITEQVSKGATFTKESAVAQKSIKESAKEIEKSTAKRLTDLGEINKLESEFQNLISSTQKIVSENEKERAEKLKITAIQNNEIDFSAGFTPTEEIAEVAPQLENLQAEVSPILETLGQAFAGLGNQIANSLNIGNDALKGFVGTLISNTPKIIQAVFQQVAANKKAAIANFASSKIEATGKSVVTATNAASSLGPLGLALLPVFVGGAVALISKAFGGGGGGGGGGGSVGSSVASQSFTGGGVGGLGGGNRDLTGELVVRGNDLVYVLGQSNNKIAKG
jgi:hypothetical protein